MSGGRHGAKISSIGPEFDVDELAEVLDGYRGQGRKLKAEVSMAGRVKNVTIEPRMGGDGQTEAGSRDAR